MKRSLLAALFTILTFLSLFSYVYSIASSPLGQFNVTIWNVTNETQLILNYTNFYQGNITLSTNASYGSLTLELLNASADSKLSENYTQSNSLTKCTNITLTLQRYDNNYTTELLGLTPSSSRNFTLIANATYLDCLPGAYLTTKFTTRNKTQTNETANITIRLDIPLSSKNTLSKQTGMGSFSGKIPANASTYHSFFFNMTSSNDGDIANITGFAVNLTADSDADVFVLNNAGLLKAKSINKSTNSEWLFFSNPSEFSATPSMWEIRVYGNNTTSQITYTGNLIFTTLNITNSTSQKPVDINFNIMNATTNTTMNLTFSNAGNITLTEISENKEMYYVKMFGNSSMSNFSLFIPGSGVISKVKASLNWTGGANYTLNIYYPNSSLAGTSSNKFYFANVTGVMQEEYNETLSIPTASGIWKFEVVNNTVAVSPFNVTVYAYYTASSWIATNLTGTTLTLNPNSSSLVQFNFTIPSTAMNGTHEGYVQYLDNRKSGIRIPLKVEVTTPMLVVNNTLSSMTYQRNENYGVNVTIFNTYFNISNPGNYNLSITWASSENMSCSGSSPVSCTGYNATFFFNNTTSNIPANSFFLLNVTMVMNSSLPIGTLYSGWIKINGTNEANSNLTAHPYPDFTINLILNVTKYMNLIINDVKSIDGTDNIAYNPGVTNTSENITVRFTVQTINETNNINTLTIDNITSVFLQEGNVTTVAGRIPITGNVSFFNGTNPFYYGNFYNLNVTIPAFQPGGRYKPIILMTHYSQSNVYNVTTVNPSNNVIVVNNSGFFMSTNTSGSSCSFGADCANPTITVSNGSTTTVFINISNYGPVGNTSANLTASYSCSDWTISPSTLYYYNCPNAAGTTTLNASGYSTTCIANYSITAPSGNGTCAISFIGYPSFNWFNRRGVNITFSSSASTTATTTTSSASGATSSGTSSAAANYLDITDYPSLVIATQGKTNSTTVKVKNTNTTYTQLIKLTIENLNSSWYSISPSTTQSTAALATVNFTVLFSPAADAAIKDYTASFKATSDYSSTEKSFTLRVLPTEATKAQINASLDQFKANVTALEAELNSLKVWYNMSAAETKLNQLKTKINESENFIKAGDYNSAYALFDTIKSLINDVKTEIENAKKQGLISPSNAVTYALIGGGVVAAVILAYLFWPSKQAVGRAAVTEKAGLIFGKTKEAGVGFKDRIKEALSKVKSKFSRQKTESNYKLKP